MTSPAPSGVKAPVESGGGWVNDCDPAAEFQKTVSHSKAIHTPQWLCYGGWRERVLKAVARAGTFANA